MNPVNKRLLCLKIIGLLLLSCHVRIVCTLCVYCVYIVCIRYV